jgi:hypothetical protein
MEALKDRGFNPDPPKIAIPPLNLLEGNPVSGFISNANRVLGYSKDEPENTDDYFQD